MASHDFKSRTFLEPDQAADFDILATQVQKVLRGEGADDVRSDSEL